LGFTKIITGVSVKEEGDMKRTLKRFLYYVLIIIFLAGSLACRKKAAEVARPPDIVQNYNEIASNIVKDCDTSRSDWAAKGTLFEAYILRSCADIMARIEKDLNDGKIKNDKLKELVKKYKTKFKKEQ
jgi:hypothetical protein